MAGYSSYSLKSIKQTFNLIEEKTELFHGLNVKKVQPSEWLLKTLEKGTKLIALNNEKSRSEYVVAPIMLEITENNVDKISCYSGEVLAADKKRGLTGECDFIISRRPRSSTIEVPIICMVEAENDNIMSGMGQCVAQMLGAALVNEQDNTPQPFIYGCVTTGNDWKFLKLEGNMIYTDIKTYYLDNLDMILGVFNHIVQEF